jgi:hypothetical protein
MSSLFIWKLIRLQTDLLLAVINVFMDSLSDTIVSAVRLVVIGCSLAAVVIVRPFADWSKNLGLMLILLAALLTASIPLFAAVLDSASVAVTTVYIAYTAFGIALTFLGSVVLATLYTLILRHFLQPYLGPLFFVLRMLRRVFSAPDARRLEYVQLGLELRSNLRSVATQHGLQGAVEALADQIDDSADDAAFRAGGSPKGEQAAGKDWMSPLHSNALSRLLLKRPDHEVPLPAAQGSMRDLQALVRSIKHPDGLRLSPVRLELPTLGMSPLAAASSSLRLSLPPLRRPGSPELPQSASSGEVSEPGNQDGGGGGGEDPAFASQLRQRIGSIVDPPLETRTLGDALRRAALAARAQQRELRRVASGSETRAPVDEKAQRALSLFWPAKERSLRPLVRRPHRPAAPGMGFAQHSAPSAERMRSALQQRGGGDGAVSMAARALLDGLGSSRADRIAMQPLARGVGDSLRQAFPAMASAAPDDVVVPGTLGDTMDGNMVSMRQSLLSVVAGPSLSRPSSSRSFAPLAPRPATAPSAAGAGSPGPMPPRPRTQQSMRRPGSSVRWARPQSDSPPDSRSRTPDWDARDTDGAASPDARPHSRGSTRFLLGSGRLVRPGGALHGLDDSASDDGSEAVLPHAPAPAQLSDGDSSSDGLPGQ